MIILFICDDYSEYKLLLNPNPNPNFDLFDRYIDVIIGFAGLFRFVLYIHILLAIN